MSKTSTTRQGELISLVLRMALFGISRKPDLIPNFAYDSLSAERSQCNSLSEFQSQASPNLEAYNALRDLDGCCCSLHCRCRVTPLP